MGLLLSIAIYLIGLVLISVYLSRKSKNKETDFLISSRKRNWKEIAFSKYALSIGVTWFITYTAYAYQFGWSVLYMFAAFFVSYLVFAFWAVPKIYKNSKEKEFLSTGDYAKNRTGSHLAKVLVDTIISLNAFIWLTIGFVGGAKIIETLGIMSYDAAVLLSAMVVFVYLLLAGFRAVIATDIIQANIVLISLLAIIIAVFSMDPNGIATTISNARTLPMDIGLLIGLIIYGFFSVFSLADRYQLTYSAKSVEDAKKGMTASFFPIFISALVLVFIGLLVKAHFPDIDPDLAFITFITEYITGPLAVALALMLVAALMSSMDTNAFNLSSYIMNIFYRNTQNPQLMVKRQRNIMSFAILVAVALAFVWPDIVELTVLGAGITLASSVAMIYLFSGGKNPIKFNLSLIFGAIGLIIGIALFGIDPKIALFPIIFASLPLIFPGRFLYRFEKFLA